MSSSVSLSALINRFIACAAPLPKAILQRQHGDVYDLCVSLGILRHIGLASTIACTACIDDPHPCRVIASGRAYRIRCFENGWIDVPVDAVMLMAFNREALIAALTVAAGVEVKQIKLYANDKLIRIGLLNAPFRSSGWMLAYSDGLEDENILAGVVDILASVFPQGPGLVATPSVIPLNLTLPSKYRLISLDDLVVAANSHLVIHHVAATERLGDRTKATRRAGRPSRKETAREIWTMLHARDDWPVARRDQADMILRHWPEDKAMLPERGTVENLIRDFEKVTGDQLR